MVDATSFTSTVPVPYIDDAGCHIPAFADVYAALQSDYRSVYGQDTVLDPDTQDGQWVGIQAVAFNDCFAVFAAVYNAYSPTTAQGAGLASIVKTNGIAKLVASYSSVDVACVGQFGASVTNGQIRDAAGNLWTLPSLSFPASGTVTVTAMCTVLGAITAPAGTLWTIATPTKGWQTVSNSTDAAPGAPVENDPALRQRQSQSTMLPAQNVLDGMMGAIAAVPNVVRYRAYENDTSTTNALGIPGHSISIVADGGDATAIATIIANRKTGGGTYGTTPVVITSAQGIPRTISFFRPTEPPITYTIAVQAYAGFTADVEALIQQAVSDWTNALGIGAGQIGMVLLGQVYGPALLIGTPVSNTFKILSIQAARDGNPVSAADITIAFNEAPYCEPDYVTVLPS